MRIGIDARFYGSLGKGLGRYTEKLITHLESLPDNQTEYVIFLREENYPEYQPRDARFRKVLADYPWYGWQEQLLFPRLIAKQHLDLIHFPHFNVPLLVTVPFLVTIHDLILLHFPTVKASELPPFLYWLKYRAYRVVIAHAIRRARAIITVSRFTKTDLETVYPAAEGKITVTSEAADGFCFWQDPEREKKLLHSLGLLSSQRVAEEESVRPFALYVGNAYPHKNLGMIIQLALRFPNHQFLCVGKADFFYRNFKREVVSANCKNIHFTGYLSDNDLGVLYRRADAYLFPSFYEGFGLPGLEAMTYGTPVVAANAGSLPEIYEKGAYYFDPHSVESCADAFTRACHEGKNASHERSVRFHQAARFSWERMAKETALLYETLVYGPY